MNSIPQLRRQVRGNGAQLMKLIATFLIRQEHYQTAGGNIQLA
jgi:hypothetical protein